MQGKLLSLSFARSPSVAIYLPWPSISHWKQPRPAFIRISWWFAQVLVSVLVCLRCVHALLHYFWRKLVDFHDLNVLSGVAVRGRLHGFHLNFPRSPSMAIYLPWEAAQASFYYDILVVRPSSCQCPGLLALCSCPSTVLLVEVGGFP